MEKKILNEMFDSLLHIGNKTNYWSPKMKSFIYGSTNGVHVFNLLETAKKIEEVKAELKELSSQGKKVLFVATKLQARDAFAALATETNNFYVNEKWVPGLLTNFKSIKKRISTYLKLLKDSSNGTFDVLTKKEKAAKMLELEKLDRAFKGLKEMKAVPDVVFVVDGAYEIQAVKEANSLKLSIYSMANTNTDVDLMTNIIPANTNSIKSIKYIANTLKDVVKSSGAARGGMNKMQKPILKKIVQDTPIKKEAKAEVKAPVEKKAAAPKKETAKADDLTKVEGVGPKTAEALNAAGVTTFAEMSKKSSKEISEIISEVRGSHITDTWPKQAEMAAAGKWDELKLWQDELDGGKPASK